MTEQKRGRGRPENNDNEVLTAILNNEDKRKEFVEAIENLVYHKRKVEADMLLHKEDGGKEYSVNLNGRILAVS